MARGIRLADIGAFAAAETDFSKAVELAPQNPHVLALRAACLAENGQPERAIPDFEQALTYSAGNRWRDGVPIDVAASILSERTPLFATFRTDDYFQRLAHAVRHLTQGTLRQQHWTSLEVGMEQLYAPAALALLAGEIRAVAAVASEDTR
jgi:tetratricopeptide (TPR) repeat protein